MGLKNGSKVSWKTEKLSIDLALKALQKIVAIKHAQKQQQFVTINDDSEYYPTLRAPKAFC